MARETWYVMEDGSVGDPRHIAPDKAGILRHDDGRAVAYAPHGPRSRNIDTDDARAKPMKGKAEIRDMKADDNAKRGYTTRQSKAD